MRQARRGSSVSSSSEPPRSFAISPTAGRSISPTSSSGSARRRSRFSAISGTSIHWRSELPIRPPRRTFRNRSSTVVKAWVFGVIVVLTSVAASAQTSRAADAETIRARQRIALIEGMLERAVQNGVDNFSRQIQALAPNADGMAMLMGAPQVRGFPLVPGGVFFDVLMPSLQLSMTWPLRYSQSSDPAALSKLSDLRSELERLSDPQARLELTQRVREIEMQLAGPPQPTRRR